MMLAVKKLRRGNVNQSQRGIEWKDSFQFWQEAAHVFTKSSDQDEYNVRQTNSDVAISNHKNSNIFRR